MGKGLPRSLARAKGKDSVKVMHVKVDHAMAFATASTAKGGATVVVGDFPEGNILFLGAVSNVKFTLNDTDVIAADWEGDYSVGTTADANVTLDGTDVNIIASTGTAAATAGASPITRGTGSTLAIFDNTDGSLELNLNLIVDAADAVDDESGTIQADGDLWVAYAVLGDD